MTLMTVPELVAQIVERRGGDLPLAAEELGVSPATLSRWRSGATRPRSQLERRLRALVAEPHDLISLVKPEQHQHLIQLEEFISSTLNHLREEFHRSASVSTRQEVLDLVASFVFAHVVSIDNGGKGIGPHLADSQTDPVGALNRFLAETFALHLQGTWRKSFLPLKSTDQRFCQALLQIFSQNASAFHELHKAGRDDLINEVFSRFMSTSFVDEKEMGQYLTPPEIVRFMVQIGLETLRVSEGKIPIDPQNGSGFLLDPSCGVGSFLAETIRRLHEKLRADLPTSEASNCISQFVSQQVIGIDKSERMIRLAAINLSLFGSDARKLYVANALARYGSDAQIGKALEGRVGLILTNPPFGATFSGSDIIEFAIGENKRKAESEVLFLERYTDWLVPGGVVVSVVPDSVLVNKSTFSELRALLYKKCHVQAIISLPAVTFAAAGTSTKTSILVMRKRDNQEQKRPTYFAEARDVGFDVITRSGQRRRVRTVRNDLALLLSEYLGERTLHHGTRHFLSEAVGRWDAPYHVGLPNEIAVALRNGKPFIKVSDVVSLVDERADPRRLGKEEFEYIEISDIDVRTGLVGHKRILSADAPSRARKQVRAGDVLVSTVRPERGSIGMVPPNLDGAICSTGFAVLRCFAIEPLALVWLLKTRFVRHQLLLNNIGIAYPAISEEACLGLVLPATREEIESLSIAAKKYADSQIQFENARLDLLSQAGQLDLEAVAHSR